MALIEVSSSRCFNGFQKVFEHQSEKLGCRMKFGVYLPDLKMDTKTPTLFYLSGLTCTEENFIMKSGMQRNASREGIIVINPDTSPRGVVTGDENDPNFGASAGFYLDATQPKWAKNYQMYSYFVEELVPLVFNTFPIDYSRCGIFGHSMGGHGAISIGLKNPGVFKSISAFAPICHPSKSSLAIKYYNAFLGEGNHEVWSQYDSVELAKTYVGPNKEVLIDQGSVDGFLKAGDLGPEDLMSVNNPALRFNYRLQEGYDHGYFFVQTFIEDHFRFHIDKWEKEELIQ